MFTRTLHFVAFTSVYSAEALLLRKQELNNTETKTVRNRESVSQAKGQEEIFEFNVDEAHWWSPTSFDAQSLYASKSARRRHKDKKKKKKGGSKTHEYREAFDDVVEDVQLTVQEIPWNKYRNERQHECPPMMVFIMSSRASSDRRSEIRKMWSASVGWGVMSTRFAVCKHPAENEDPIVRQHLEEEAHHHNDLTYLACAEGYTRGLLTRKVFEAMKKFESPDRWVQKHELFMKTDDDTFVSPSRLCDFLSTHQASSNRFNHSYIGVFAEAGERLKPKRPPCRDPKSLWYEPYEKFKGDLYPISAKGGPGYILSRSMVQKLLSKGIAESNLLNNEDRAVGVWVDELKKRGNPIRYINLPGTDGYEDYHPGLIAKSGKWSEYPYAIHHHLTGEEIVCLHDIDQAGEEKTTIDKCFANNNAHLFYAAPLPRRGSGDELESTCR